MCHLRSYNTGKAFPPFGFMQFAHRKWATDSSSANTNPNISIIYMHIAEEKKRFMLTTAYPSGSILLSRFVLSFLVII